MLRIYFGAFVGTSLLMSMISVFCLGVVWLILSSFHASHSVITGGEVIMGIALVIGTVFLFKRTLIIERELFETGDLK